jgi:hypothetical protein
VCYGVPSVGVGMSDVGRASGLVVLLTAGDVSLKTGVDFSMFTVN